MLINVVKKVHEYTNKKGEKKKEFRFYLVINGNYVRFMPYYLEKKDSLGNVIYTSNTYKEINLVADLIDDSSDEE